MVIIYARVFRSLSIDNREKVLPKLFTNKPQRYQWTDT